MNKDATFYRGNPNLLNGNVQQDYEGWQLEEILKCSNDPKYFINNYVNIITPKGIEKFTLRSYQEKIIDNIHNETRFIFLSGRQSGKCATDSTTIKVRNKKTMEVSEITIKDFINITLEKNNLSDPTSK